MERKSRGRDKEPGGQRSRSRDSSGSVSSEVRCGCQYFQSDSLLPERQSLVGRPPSRASATGSASAPGDARVAGVPARTVQGGGGRGVAQRSRFGPAAAGKSRSTDTESEQEDLSPFLDVSTSSLYFAMGDHDHEYEPVIPMTSHHQSPPPTVRITDADNPEGAKADSLVGSDISSIESHERQFLRMANEDGLYDDENHDDEEDGVNLSAKELQTRLEERFFTSTPTTTGSRTDGEIHTSQVDSSALEDLPLTRDARRTAEPRTTFQQKIRSQAGRIRTKFRTMSRKPKPHSEGESSEPSEHQEKSRFTFPRRPKISFPERPKFNFPERPKFSLPERPKFNLPSRPKISMPSMPSLTRQKSASTRRPLKEKPPAAQSSGARKMFDFDFKTYPRIFSKRKKAELNGGRKGGRAATPPPRMECESAPATPLHRKSSFGTKWTHRYTDLKFADDDDEKSERCESRFISLKGSNESLSGFKDSDFPDAVMIDESPISNRREECQQSASSYRSEQDQSESPDHRLRRGVLEEIDADEFFLRKKGLSRENVDVSNFLTQEIRDALRSGSSRNALAHLETEIYDTEKEKAEAEKEKPTAPQRTRSLRRSSRSNKSQSVEQGPESEGTSNYFNTFPPDRPERRRRSGTVNSQRERDKSSVDSIEMRNLEDARRVSTYDDDAYSDKASLKSGQDYYLAPKESIPPLPPKRKRSSRDITQDNDSLDEEQYHEDWIRRTEDHAKIPSRETGLNGIHLVNGDPNQYDLPPNAPQRRTRSRGTSLVDEDRTSREAESLPSERMEEFPRDNEIRDVMDGYAVVEKSSKTEKPIKPPRPPPPGRQKKRFRNIKSQGFSYFFTVPRRRQSSFSQQYQQYICNTPPVRPYRNYSTIGPSRPPRRNKVFREPVYADGDDKENTERVKTIEDEELERDIEELIKNAINDQLNENLMQDDGKNLNSGDVIQKMKARPLPAPPRPPRRTREDGEYEDPKNDQEGNVELHLRSLNASPEPVVEREFVSRQETASIEENSRVSGTQNDLNKAQSLETISDSQRNYSRSSTISRRAPSRKNSATKRSKTPLPQDRLSGEDTEKNRIEDVSVSTQTDVLPEGYVIEEERQTDDKSQTDSSYPTTTATLTGSDSASAALVERKVILLPDKELEVEILKTKKLQVSEIDVEKLNVTEINTNKIRVSEVDGVSMHIAEINSRSGNIVINNLELPQSVLESISRNLAELQSTSAGTSSSEVPESMLRLSQRGRGGLGVDSSVVPVSGTHRVIDSQLSSEDGALSLPPRREPTVYELSQQMFDIIQRNVSKFVERSIQNGLIDIEKQREIQHTISIVLIVVAVLYLIGFGSGSTIHTHHWDFQFPPPQPPR